MSRRDRIADIIALLLALGVGLAFVILFGDAVNYLPVP